jgi:hypothetical protein
LAGVDDWADIRLWLTALRRSRQVFHSEADFQHALAFAMATSDPGVRIRLETRPVPGMRLDLLVSRPGPGEYLAVELKYLTAAWAGEADGEHFELLSQGAQDVRAYDVVKDVQRVERLVGNRPGSSGLVLVLANDPAYWSRPAHGRATNADAFRIYEGQVLSGRREWGPHTGAGTMKDRVEAIELLGSYRCHWSEYSSLPGSRGTFRLLALAVSAQGKATHAVARPGQAGQAETPAGQGQQPSRPASRECTGSSATTREQGTARPPDGQRYSTEELRAELVRFERELREAGLKDNSVTTYVDRTGRFLKWLEGDYQPRGSSLSTVARQVLRVRPKTRYRRIGARNDADEPSGDGGPDHPVMCSRGMTTAFCTPPVRRR